MPQEDLLPPPPRLALNEWSSSLRQQKSSDINKNKLKVSNALSRIYLYANAWWVCCGDNFSGFSGCIPTKQISHFITTRGHCNQLLNCNIRTFMTSTWYWSSSQKSMFARWEVNEYCTTCQAMTVHWPLAPSDMTLVANCYLNINFDMAPSMWESYFKWTVARSGW